MTVFERAQHIEEEFVAPTHDERVAAVLGVALGVAFTTCFVTGLFSHFAQHPPGWFTLPARPAGLYRFTQGLHVATGIAAIPLLAAKLWAVYPQLFTWPVVRSLTHAIERIGLLFLVGGSIFMLFTGLENVSRWYPWGFYFPDAHYWVAWITIGGIVMHVGAKIAVTRAALRRTGGASPPEPASTDDQRDQSDRRAFLAMAFGTSALVTAVTIGQTLRPLARLAVLAPRRPNVGPQGFPVNRTASEAGVVTAAQADDFSLTVIGPAGTQTYTLAELRAMPTHSATLPIACVEGWSAERRWTGVRVRDLVAAAGGITGDATVFVESLQARGGYRTSELNRSQALDRDTLLAHTVNGEPLALDHGYPLRLIAPDRPGVMQTKWVHRLEVR